MGQHYGYVLCNAKPQQPSLQYLQIREAQRRIHKERVTSEQDKHRNTALAIGKFGIGILLASFDCHNQRLFSKLPLTDAMYIAITTILHTGGARHGQFVYHTPSTNDMVWTSTESAYRLKSTWRKTNKTSRPYFLTFPKTPRFEAFVYEVPRDYGVATDSTKVTACDIISWYLRRPDVRHLHRTPRAKLFPLPYTNRRQLYQTWLQQAFAYAIPTTNGMHRLIRPHSMRAGCATDLRAEGIPDTIIMKLGRWQFMFDKAMHKYDRTNLRTMLTSDAFLYQPGVEERRSGTNA